MQPLDRSAIMEEQYGMPRVRITGHRQVDTMYVKVRATGNECWINASDFDKRKHEELKAPRVRPTINKRKVNPDEVPMTRETLGGMTFDQLVLLPQFIEIPNRTELSSKEAVIEALLAAAGVVEEEEETEE